MICKYKRPAQSLAHNKKLSLPMVSTESLKYVKNLETRLEEMWQNNSGCLWIRIKDVLFPASLHFLMISFLFPIFLTLE